MSYTARMRELGRPWILFHGWKYAGQPIIKEGRQMGDRESDDAIVPMKAGNAAGGKGVMSVTTL